MPKSYTEDTIKITVILQKLLQKLYKKAAILVHNNNTTRDDLQQYFKKLTF